MEPYRKDCNKYNDNYDDWELSMTVGELIKELLKYRSDLVIQCEGDDLEGNVQDVEVVPEQGYHYEYLLLKRKVRKVQNKEL